MLRPSYHAQLLDDGRVMVHVTPHPLTRLPTAQVTLTKAQLFRFADWLSGKCLIQAALPEVSPEEREILMTGIDQTKWDELFPEEGEVET